MNANAKVEVKLKGMNPELQPVLEFDIPLTFEF